ncbi:MAG TPA: hypothetical protein VNQ73_15385 [Ilumatobacter sp.]|nr:hypothetical protein [Ilumatobacter sp.]
MSHVQITVLELWLRAGDALGTAQRRLRSDRDRGEVTATTALIVILVIAAIAAATVIATKMTDNADNVPSP